MMFLLFVLWIVAECIFAVYCYQQVKRWNKIKPTPKLFDSASIFRILDLIAQTRSYSIQKFFEGFFIDAKWNDIYRDNVASFLWWACANINYVNSEEISIIIDTIEYRYGVKFPLGFNPHISHIGMSLQPVQYVYQPLILYLTYFLLRFATDKYLYYLGFSKIDNYFHRPGTKNIPPLLVLHGISPGWFSYLPLIRTFNRDQPVILYNVNPYTIGSLDFSTPSPDEISQNIVDILSKHDYSTCDIVAHSFGTITTAWMVNRYPSRIRKIVLLDPVSLLLSLPEVASNFLYRRPRTWFHWIIRIFAAREITIAHSLYRNFDWTSNILWLEDVNIPIKVSLTLTDEIIPVDPLLEYVDSNSTLLWNNFSHSQMVAISPLASKSIYEKLILD